MINKLTLTYPIDINNGSTVPNVHIFIVKYLQATNHAPARFKLISERYFKESKKGAKIFGYRGELNFNSSLEYAVNELILLGFNILAKGEGKEVSYIVTDTFKVPFE